MTPNRTGFLAQLRRFRRRVWRGRLSGAAADAFAAALWSAAAVAAGYWLTGRGGREMAAVPAAVFCAVLPGLWLKRRPGFLECARLADRCGGERSLAVNALELIRRGAQESPFAEYAVRQGAAQLAAAALPAASPARRGKILIPVVLTLILLLLPKDAIPARTGTPTARRSAAKEQTIPPMPAGDDRRLQKNAERTLGGSAASPIPTGKNVAAAAISGYGGGRGEVRQAGPAGGCGGGNGKDGKAAEERPETRPGPHTAAADPAKGASAGGFAGSGDTGGDEATSLAVGMNNALADGLRTRGVEKRRRKTAARQKTGSRGGFHPLLPDTAPPAGRELAEKDEHGDRPGDGRGGDTGNKKSRGAAASLPVTPQPDTVAGRLGSGEDAVSTDPAVPGRGGPGGGPIASGARETASSPPTAPSAVRRMIHDKLELYGRENSKND